MDIKEISFNSYLIQYLANNSVFLPSLAFGKMILPDVRLLSSKYADSNESSNSMAEVAWLGINPGQQFIYKRAPKKHEKKDPDSRR